MVEGRRILPTFAEGVSDVANRRSAYLEVNAVPRRSITVSGFEIDRLRVAFVTAVVVAAMTQVDPADERHVVVRSGSVAHNDELLVMASAATDAFVEKNPATGFVDLANEPGVLLLEEVRPTRV